VNKRHLLRGTIVGILAWWLGPAQAAFAQQKPFQSSAAPHEYRAVLLFVTYFEVDGMRFESIEDLRTYLLSASSDFMNLDIRDCAARDRVQQLMRVMQEVISDRFARRNQQADYEF